MRLLAKRARGVASIQVEIENGWFEPVPGKVRRDLRSGDHGNLVQLRCRNDADALGRTE